MATVNEKSKLVKRPLGAKIDVQKFALKDMVVESETKAREEAEQAQKEEQMRRCAYDEGFSKGQQEGIVKGIAKGFKEGKEVGLAVKGEEIVEYNRLTKLLLQLSSDVKCLTEKNLSKVEQNLLKVSVAIAERILRKEIAADSEAVLGFVTEGLQKITPVEMVSIRIHPQDVAFLTRKTPELLQAVEGIPSLRFEIDPTLLPGDCIVESREQSVDGRLKSQLSRMEQHLILQGNSEKEKL
ncbi:MAG: FliH/SctL family protein [Nitrospirota bacterium]